MMKKLAIDRDDLEKSLIALLNTPSPSGYCDPIVHLVGEALQADGIEFHVTRRGAIRATLPGAQKTPDRAVAVHLDTIGAMVAGLKPNGRLALAPVGTWSSRFAEGARVTVFGAGGPLRGTVLPLKASGHIFADAVNAQPTDWAHVEIRLDVRCLNDGDLNRAGIAVGDFVAFDATPEISGGFVNARHLDDKAGVATLLAVAHAVATQDVALPVDAHLLFTISEEVGSGAAHVLYADVAEMVIIDHAPVGPGQHSSEYGVTIGMMDMTGPFDYHLSQKLIGLCQAAALPYCRDIFKFYRTDSASAIEAGNDIRTALIGFGLDASHGYERTHMDSLMALADLIGLYLQSPPTFTRDKDDLAPLNGFPRQPTRPIIQIKT